MSKQRQTLADYYDFLADERWEGTAEDLAKVATEFGIDLGILNEGKVLTERLVKDYVQRGVIDKPERKGKEAYYRTTHLDQLLEARQMISSGLRLSAIPHMKERGEFQAMRLDPQNFQHARSSARMAFEQIKNDYASGAFVENDREQPLLGTKSMGSVPSDQGLERELIFYSREMPIFHKSQLEDVEPIQQTRFAIAPGVELTLENSQLENLSESELNILLEKIEASLKDQLP